MAKSVKPLNVRILNNIHNVIDLKVSYHKRWDCNGTTYNQMINITIPRETFRKLNNDICVYKLNCPSYDNAKMYLDTFKKGYNYTSLTQRNFFCKFFELPIHEGSIFKDRNTLIKINIK